MAKKTKIVHIKSALPIYGGALAFFLLALILPIYKLWAIILAGAISVGAGFGLTKVFPGRDAEVTEEVFTGDKELDAQIIACRATLDKFRLAAENAGDAKVKSDLERIIKSAEGVVDEVISDKGDRGDAYTFFSYYIPTLDKLLSYYTDFALAVKGENAEKSRVRIEGCLAMTADAFEKFLDKLYRNETAAIKANVDVLKTIMRSEGLADKGSDLNARLSAEEQKLAAATH